MTPERIAIETIGWTGMAPILAAYVLLSWRVRRRVA